MNAKKFDFNKFRSLINSDKTETEIRNILNIKTQETLKRLLYELSIMDKCLYKIKQDMPTSHRIQNNCIIINASYLKYIEFDVENVNLTYDEDKNQLIISQTKKEESPLIQTANTNSAESKQEFAA